MAKNCTLYLFQQDLRLKTNNVLNELAKNTESVFLLYMYPKFLAGTSQEIVVKKQISLLNNQLAEYNTQITVIDYNDIEAIRNIISSYKVSTLYFEYTYNRYCVSENKVVKELLSAQNVALIGLQTSTLIPPYKVSKPDGSGYAKFSAFQKKWLSLIPEYIKENSFKLPTFVKLEVTHLDETFRSQISLPKANHDLKHYATKRDFPAKAGTSFLSSYLAIGAISHLEAYQFLSASSTAVSELIWREFFIHVGYHSPYSYAQNFKSKYNGIEWRNNEEEFKKWCNGETGFPLVDAGMRELNTTGLMHNRVRMVVASFLCKHLLIEWQWGATYFAQKLIDFDPAINAGNWQWVAGTGCDSAPYFRIFNPITQLQKFDPLLGYTKKWVTNLNHSSYPVPMVDHKLARERALRTYKDALNPA